jgi:hypothetical protein
MAQGEQISPNAAKQQAMIIRWKDIRMCFLPDCQTENRPVQFNRLYSAA